MNESHPPGPPAIDVRVKLAALWASTMMIFAYVDLFSLYRADVRAKLEAGRMAAFPVDQNFLLVTTAYVIVPSLMIYLSVVSRTGPTASPTSPWPPRTRSPSPVAPSASGTTLRSVARSSSGCSPW